MLEVALGREENGLYRLDLVELSNTNNVDKIIITKGGNIEITLLDGKPSIDLGSFRDCKGDFLQIRDLYKAFEATKEQFNNDDPLWMSSKRREACKIIDKKLFDYLDKNSNYKSRLQLGFVGIYLPLEYENMTIDEMIKSVNVIKFVEEQ